MSDDQPTARVLPPHLAVTSGLLMGGADAIPGVSGGTIALILGIYEQFIDSLAAVVRSPSLVRTADGRAQIGAALRLLIPLGIGVVIAYYLATKLLVGKTEEPGLMIRTATAPACYAFFFGLVLVSVREPWRRIAERGAQHYVAAALGCAGAALFVGLPHTGANDGATWLLILGGAGAIAVMLLPGVSGSLFLVIIGQYETVVRAVHDRHLASVGIFLAGIALGILLFIPALRWLLHRHHELTMATLTGLMAGSLRALWPWKSGYDPKVDALSNQGISGSGGQIAAVAIAALAGGAVVWLLAILERRIERNTAGSGGSQNSSSPV